LADPASRAQPLYRGATPATSRTVSMLTRTTCPTSRTMCSGSSARLGSDRMPLRLSSLTWLLVNHPFQGTAVAEAVLLIDRSVLPVGPSLDGPHKLDTRKCRARRGGLVPVWPWRGRG